jgi:hypothetical protein
MKWYARAGSNRRPPPCQLCGQKVESFACFAFPVLTISRMALNALVLVTSFAGRILRVFAVVLVLQQASAD